MKNIQTISNELIEKYRKLKTIYRILAFSLLSSFAAHHLTILVNLANIKSMKTVSIHDAKTNLSKYIKEVKAGNPIYIGGFGQAEVALVAIEKKSGNRNFSLIKDKISVEPDAFSPETDQEIAELMLGEPSE